MSRFTILLAGELEPTSRLAAQIADSRVIAADSGIRHAQTLGLMPELWVGDFDSVPPVLDGRLAAVERRSFPREKDQTDGELAVDKALARGASSLVLAGAFGGPRFDHVFLHAALSLRLLDKGIPILLTSGAQEGAPLVNGVQEFDYEEGTVFSVVGFGDLEGLTIEGAHWPLHDVSVPFGSSWTVSNEVCGKLRITLATGRAMIIAHPYPAEGF